MAAVYLLLFVFIAGLSLNIRSDQFLLLTVSGFIGLVLGDSFLFKAYQIIGARVSMLLMSVSPAFTALIAYFFLGESLSLLGIIGIMVTMAGIWLVLIDTKGNENSRFTLTFGGIVLGLLGALGQSGGLVFAKAAFNAGELNGFVATTIRILTATLVLAPGALIARKLKNPIRLFTNDRKALLYTAGGAFFGPFLGISFSLIAIANTTTGIAAVLMSTVPVLMLPGVHYIHKEKLTVQAIMGAIIAVGGVAILFLR
jgi:drug/metabolite transporter (DMT)-like permease